MHILFTHAEPSSARVIATIACLCVAGIVSKRLNVGSRKQHHVIAPGI